MLLFFSSKLQTKFGSLVVTRLRAGVTTKSLIAGSGNPAQYWSCIHIEQLSAIDWVGFVAGHILLKEANGSGRVPKQLNSYVTNCRRLSVYVIVTLFMNTIVSVASVAMSPAEIFRIAERSVVMIKVEGFTKEHKHFVDYASGFIVNDRGLVVTARHIIPDVQKFESFVIECSAGERALENPSWKMKVVALHDSDDVAILEIVDFAENRKSLKLTRFQLGDSKASGPGDWVYVLGYPEGESLTIHKGLITGRSMEGRMWRTDAPLNPGTSGGPVLLGGTAADATVVASVKGAVRYTSTGVPTDGWGYLVLIEQARSLIQNTTSPAAVAYSPPQKIRIKERLRSNQIQKREVLGNRTIQYTLKVTPERVAEHVHPVTRTAGFRITQLKPS